MSIYISLNFRLTSASWSIAWPHSITFTLPGSSTSPIVVVVTFVLCNWSFSGLAVEDNSIARISKVSAIYVENFQHEVWLYSYMHMRRQKPINHLPAEPINHLPAQSVA